MRKIYFALAGVFLLTVFNFLKAQEMLVGGDMETGDAWTIISCTGTTGMDVNNEFGYYDDGPLAGQDGCFHSWGSENASDVNQLLYQKVTIQEGVKYSVDLAFKNTIEFNGMWVEVYIGISEPEEGADTYVVGGELITFFGGWKYSAWVPECSDLNDGTLSENSCLTPSGDLLQADTTFLLEGTGEQDVYFGVKFGLGWATGPYSYNVMFDNISMMGPDVSAIEVAADQAINRVYPNPAANRLMISNVEANDIQIFDAVGNKVYFTSDLQSEMTIDISGLVPGFYFLKANDSVSKFIKK